MNAAPSSRTAPLQERGRGRRGEPFGGMSGILGLDGQSPKAEHRISLSKKPWGLLLTESCMTAGTRFLGEKAAPSVMRSVISRRMSPETTETI